MNRRFQSFTLPIAIVVFLTILQSASARSEDRLALVIGNSAYIHTAPLRNPSNDADLVAQSLDHVGFKVTKVLNATRDQMMRAILDFGRSLRRPNTVGLFYYAGHGVHVNGLNYLVPVDADIQNEDEVRLQAISASELLQTFNLVDGAEARLNIIILDACRNNPFARGWRSVSQGLAPIDAPSGSFVAFSTPPATSPTTVAALTVLMQKSFPERSVSRASPSSRCSNR